MTDLIVLGLALTSLAMSSGSLVLSLQTRRQTAARAADESFAVQIGERAAAAAIGQSAESKQPRRGSWMGA